MIMKRAFKKKTVPAAQDFSVWLGKVGALVTLAGTLIAGFWVAFQFLYAKWVEPRLTPSMVRVVSDIKYISSTDCCHLYELMTVMENVGKREVVIHASHQVAAVRAIENPEVMNSNNYVNGKFLMSRKLKGDFEYIFRGEVDYVDELYSDFLLLSIGNIIKPKSRLLSGEVYSNRSIAAIPRKYSVASVRGRVIISHISNDNLVWMWSVMPKNLELLPMPWPGKDKEKLLQLSDCANDNKNPRWSNCLFDIKSQADENYRDFWESDSHSYVQSYAFDAVLKSNLGTEK